MKRYNLEIPNELYDEVQRIANGEGVTVLTIFRRFIKMGLIVADVEKSGGWVQIVTAEGETQNITTKERMNDDD